MSGAHVIEQRRQPVVGLHEIGECKRLAIHLKKRENNMEALAHDLQMEETIHPELLTIGTNLFELIDAINEELEPEEDWIVTAIVSDLIDRGKMRFLGSKTDNH